MATLWTLSSVFPAVGQQMMPPVVTTVPPTVITMTTHVVVQPVMVYQNVEILGFAQTIPVEFTGITALHAKALPPAERRVELDVIGTQIEEGLRVDPQNDLKLLEQAIYLFEKKEYARADSVLTELIDRSAKQLIKEEAFFYRGLMAAARSELADSEYFFSEVLQYNPKNQHARINLGLARLLQGKTNLAMETFKQAKIQMPTDVLPDYYIGVIDHLRGNQRQAAQLLRSAAIYRQKDTIVQSTVDRLIENNEDIQLLHEMEERIKDDANIYARLGFKYHEYGKLEESNIYFGKALEIAPDNYMAITGMSENHLFLGNYELSEEYADKVLKLYPHLRHQVYYGKGRIRYHAKDYDGAETILLEAVRTLTPDQQVKARAMLGQLYAEQGRLKEALEQAQHLMNHQSDRSVQEMFLKIRQYQRAQAQGN